jgi:hypothetical protein
VVSSVLLKVADGFLFAPPILWLQKRSLTGFTGLTGTQQAKGKTGILGGNRFVNPVNPVKISLHCVSACKGRTSSWFRASQWDMMDCGHLTKTGKKTGLHNLFNGIYPRKHRPCRCVTGMEITVN